MSDPIALVERLYKSGFVSKKFRDQTVKNIKKALAEADMERKK